MVGRVHFGSAQNSSALFNLLPSAYTGIAFNNTLSENDSINILNQTYIYNGGGVGIGDFNNDGLPDIYFAGNMVSNKLYINKGALKFDDHTDAAGVGGEGRWCTGVSVVDINADGWLDIYVSASFSKDTLVRTNLLYINQGLNKNGIPTFKESAAAYGLADTGYSTQGYFFDYDRDGDLDLYLVTNALYDSKTPIRFRPAVTDGSAQNTDRLYRNNGSSPSTGGGKGEVTFTNVSREAGILFEGWGHAAVRKRNLMEHTYGRIRALTVGPDGYIYFSTSENDPPEGRPKAGYDLLLRLRPSGSGNVPQQTTEVRKPVTFNTKSQKTTNVLYVELCAGCHGKNLEGTERAKNLLNRKWDYGSKRNDVIKSIRDGIINKGMPAWEGSLTKKEIEGIADLMLAKLKANEKKKSIQ